MIGQGILLVAVLILLIRIVGWILPDGNVIDSRVRSLLQGQVQVVVDVFLAGVLGYGLYFWFSGRVWCRFMCPLAALMPRLRALQPLRDRSGQEEVHLCNVAHRSATRAST